MATMKKKGRDLGKKIRKVTGLKLPIAMQFGKAIVRGNEWHAMQKESLKPYITHKMFPCGPQCCGSMGPVITGPKGDWGVYSGKEV